MKLKAARAMALLPMVLMVSNPAPAAMQEGGRAPAHEVWQPAKTPPGGVSWRLLETTKLNDRTDPKTRIIYTKPTFPKAVRALSGKRITVAGWMMPLENGIRQKHFVLLAYPPDCPFHMNALPNQFIEVYASVPVKVSELKPIVVTGTLQLTGQDESGIFYKLRNARPG